MSVINIRVCFSVDVEENVSEDQRTTASPVTDVTDTPSKDAPLIGQPVWEVEMVTERQQGSPTSAFHSIPSDEDTEDVRTDMDLVEEEEIRTSPEELKKTGEESQLELEVEPQLTVPAAPLQVPEQSELFEAQAVQSCDITDQRTALEGSQV